MVLVEQCSELSRDCNACNLLSSVKIELKQEMKSSYRFWSGKERYRLVRGINTVACKVRKIFLKRVISPSVVHLGKGKFHTP